MMVDANRWPSKLSNEFVARLASLPAHETLHAVVLLEAAGQRRATVRQTSRQRRAAIDTLREASRPVLVDMDAILAKWGGRRLDDDISALGTVAVEATPGVIKILANLKEVKTVLEDQSISMLP